MLKPPNWKSRQSMRRSVDDKVCDEVWDEVWELSMPRHTSSLSSSHALSSTLRRKTLSRLRSASPISTQKGLSCPRDPRYPTSQPIPITSRPIQFPPTNPEAPCFLLLSFVRHSEILVRYSAVLAAWSADGLYLQKAKSDSLLGGKSRKSILAR